VLGICTPLAASTGIDDPLARCAAELMSSAPPESHGKCGHTIVLEMENEERTRVVDWRLRTPDFYLAGARAAVAVTEAVANGGRVGLVSPAEVLLDGDCDLFLVPPKYGRALRDCFLDKRVLV